MTHDVKDSQPLIINVTRYGLPFIIAIFYCTASLGFEFTADSTMHVVSFVKYGFVSSSTDGFPSPLWQFLLMVGGWFHLDPLLSSKILSLLFSCLTIFMGYLVANEILRDRLIAFCISLLLAMQGWLLQIAPSGSAFSLAVALLMTALFFMLRNEYVVAPFIIGLCTLLFWHAVFLLIPLCVDIWINSISKRRAFKVMLSSVIVLLGALMPWALFAWINGAPVVPELLPVVEVPVLSVFAIVVLGLLGLLGTAGFVFSLMIPEKGRETFRANFGTLLFTLTLIIVGLLFRLDVWRVALPLVAVYAFFGLAGVLGRMRSERMQYSAVFILTGLLLVLLQFDYYRENKHAMASAVGQANDLRSAGEWIKMNSSTSESVCADQPGVVEYYAERPVALLEAGSIVPCGDLIVTSRQEVTGYDLVYRPESAPDGVGTSMRDGAVWRRKQ